jgi:hypothetical protein
LPGYTETFLLVFRNKFYVAIAVASAGVLWAFFNILDGLLLLSPVVTFYNPIPDDAIPGFVLSILTASLGGIVISQNVFLFATGQRIPRLSFISGSTLSTLSSICAGCSSFGFYAATTLGAAGVAASGFLSTYQVPLRFAAIAILVLASVAAHRKIGQTCRLPS